MKKRRKFKPLDPRFIPVRVPLDPASRKLAGSSARRLLAIANRMLNEPLIEHTPPVHTVLDDRVPVEQVSNGSHLRPTWHGRA